MTDANKRGNWVSIDFMDGRRHLPAIPCCYALYFNGKLRYIGSTKNLKNRFYGHSFRFGYGKDLITPWGEIYPYESSVMKYRESIKYGDWLMVEARMIMRLQPDFNSLMKKKEAQL